MNRKEKLWFLIQDSVVQAMCGAYDIMDNSISISLDVLCELENLNKEQIKQELYNAWDEALAAIGYRLEKQKTAIELLDYKLIKIKERLDNGEFAETANN